MNMEQSGMRTKSEFGGSEIQGRTIGLNLSSNFVIPLNKSEED